MQNQWNIAYLVILKSSDWSSLLTKMIAVLWRDIEGCTDISLSPISLVFYQILGWFFVICAVRNLKKLSASGASTPTPPGGIKTPPELVPSLAREAC